MTSLRPEVNTFFRIENYLVNQINKENISFVFEWRLKKFFILNDRRAWLKKWNEFEMTHSKKQLLNKIIPQFHQLNSSVRDDERKKLVKLKT